MVTHVTDRVWLEISPDATHSFPVEALGHRSHRCVEWFSCVRVTVGGFILPELPAFINDIQKISDGTKQGAKPLKIDGGVLRSTNQRG